MADRGYALRRGYQRPADGEADLYAHADMALAREVGAVLEAHYPGHPWEVMTDHRQGIATIAIPPLMGQNKFVIHIRTLETDPAFLTIVRAGGEILERYNIPRVGFSGADFIVALKRQPLVAHRRGNARTDNFVPA